MKPNTHLSIDPRLCGQVTALADGRAEVELLLTPEMASDDQGLVHGGFLFGAADYAAMVAVNDPFVVLGAAQVRFLRPSRVGETLSFEALVREIAGKRRIVQVVGRRENREEVFDGTFTCAVLPAHVLDASPTPGAARTELHVRAEDRPPSPRS